MATFRKYLRQATVPMWTVCEFAIHTAMRLGEITRIRWEDLDRKYKTVLIRDRKHLLVQAGIFLAIYLIYGA